MPETYARVIDPLTLADALEAGIVVHDGDTTIRYANPKALELLHLTLDQALGKRALDPHWRFLDDRGQPMPLEDYPVNRVIDGKVAIRDQVVGVVDHQGGRTTWVNVCAYPEFDGEKIIEKVVVTFVDITARVRSERLRKAQLDIALKANALDETRLLQLVLSWCETITGSSVSFFHFVNDDQETIELVTWSGRTLQEYCHVEELNRHYPISQAGIWAEAFRRKQPVVVNDYMQAVNKRGLPDGHAHLERFISMPLLDGDSVRVLLGVGNKGYAYADDDVEDLTILTDQIWRIVAQKRSETRARELAQAVEQTQAGAHLGAPPGQARGQHAGQVDRTRRRPRRASWSPWGARSRSRPSALKLPQVSSRIGSGQLQTSRSGRSRQLEAQGSRATVPYPPEAAASRRLARVSARPCRGSSSTLWGSTRAGASQQSSASKVATPAAPGSGSIARSRSSARES